MNIELWFPFWRSGGGEWGGVHDVVDEWVVFCFVVCGEILIFIFVSYV